MTTVNDTTTASSRLIAFTEKLTVYDNPVQFLNKVNLTDYVAQNWELPTFKALPLGNFNAIWISDKGSSIVESQNSLIANYRSSDILRQVTDTYNFQFRGWSDNPNNDTQFVESVFSYQSDNSFFYDDWVIGEAEDRTQAIEYKQTIDRFNWKNIGDPWDVADDIVLNATYDQRIYYRSDSNGEAIINVPRFETTTLNYNYSDANYTLSFAITDVENLETGREDTGVASYRFVDKQNNFSIAFGGRIVETTDGINELVFSEMRNITVETENYLVTTARFASNESPFDLFDPLDLNPEAISSNYFTVFEPRMLGLFDPISQNFAFPANPFIPNTVVLKNPKGLFFDAGAGNDRITGSIGDDIIAAANGDDVVMGGMGDDIIIGGRGSDRLTGGTGADIFAYRHNNFDPVFRMQYDFNDGLNNLGQPTRAFRPDVITDFRAAEGDQLDLSRVKTNLGDPVAFSASARAYSVWFASGFVNIDVDGNTTPDFQIRLLGVTTAPTIDSYILG